MNALRTLILAQQKLAFLLVALVLFARVFVPTGYMFTPTAGGIMVQMCSGQGAVPVLLDIGHAAPVEHHSSSDKMDAPCAFSGIGMASMAPVDAALLIAALAFIVAMGVRPILATPLRIVSRLRPPLRAPPAFS